MGRYKGTYRQLLAQRGIYWKLYQLQYKDQEVAQGLARHVGIECTRKPLAGYPLRHPGAAALPCVHRCCAILADPRHRRQYRGLQPH
jgi:hypothetical protein